MCESSLDEPRTGWPAQPSFAHSKAPQAPLSPRTLANASFVSTSLISFSTKISKQQTVAYASVRISGGSSALGEVSKLDTIAE